MLESRDRVIVEGKAAGVHAMRLKHVGTGARINVGDSVLTSGSLGLFPPGFLIGTVAKVEGREYAGKLEISVSSPVELAELESVIIVEMAAPEVPEENK
jgi:cell shape-determining protein MreC